MRRVHWLLEEKDGDRRGEPHAKSPQHHGAHGGREFLFMMAADGGGALLGENHLEAEGGNGDPVRDLDQRAKSAVFRVGQKLFGENLDGEHQARRRATAEIIIQPPWRKKVDLCEASVTGGEARVSAGMKVLVDVIKEVT